MSFNSYFLNIYTLMGLAALLSTAAFAWWKGGPAERLGTLILCVSAIGGDVARAFSGQLAPTVTMFVSDMFLSLGFLYIAIRYSSLWLGAAMIFQGCAFSFHATQLDDSDLPRWHGMVIYLLVHNILSYLVMLTLVGGTLATILKRRKPQTAAAAARKHPLSQFNGADSPMSRRHNDSTSTGAAT